jgi:hypothetical protein
MSQNPISTVESSAKRLFPGISPDQAFAQLLLERAKKNLIKYQVMVRGFEVKHRQNFEMFRQQILQSDPSFELEQDYFDWEMAVTGIADMTEEIEYLRELLGQS